MALIVAPARTGNHRRSITNGLLALVLAACGSAPPSGASDAQPASLEDSSVDAGAPEDAAGIADAGVPDAATIPDAGMIPDAAMISPHASFPQVVNGASGVLANLRLVTVVGSGDPLGPDLISFGQELLASAWWQVVRADFSFGTTTTATAVIGPAIAGSINTSALEGYIRAAIAGHPGLEPDGHSVYMLYLPNRVVLIDDESGGPPTPNTDCQLYGGFHTLFGGGPDNLGVAQHCNFTDPPGFQLDQLTTIGAHEIVESASDPVDGYQIPFPANMNAPWTGSVWGAWVGVGAEIGDLCDGTNFRVGRFLVQRIWSNTAASVGNDPCVPSISDPYYNVSAQNGWYPVSAGGSVRIPLSPWSSAPVADWGLSTYVVQGTLDGFSGTITSSRTIQTPMGPFPLVNDSGTATLIATAPSTATAGDWVVFEVDSSPLQGGGLDDYHYWPVGVYVQ